MEDCQKGQRMLPEEGEPRFSASPEAACPLEGQVQAPEGEVERATLEDHRLLVRKMDEWVASMESMRLADYLNHATNRRKLFWSNFLGGMARGVGMAVGFTILGAVIVLILRDLAEQHLPIIGDTLQKVLDVVDAQLQ